MIRSMTGYAREEYSDESGWLQWELRSVNHRNFDVELRLPDAFRSLEPEFRSLLAGRVGRGHVEARLAWRPAEKFADRIKVNTRLAVRVISYARVLAEEMRRPAGISPLEVMRWPGVIEEHSPDQSHMTGEVRKLLHKAADSLREVQMEEGRQLKKFIEGRCSKLGKALRKIGEHTPQLRENAMKRMRERMEAISIRVDEARLEREVAILLMRYDISEEVDRLHAHLGALRIALKSSDHAGKRVMFLLQEIGREANTLAAKAGDAKGTHEAVEMRVLVEQMREQAHNIL